MLRGLAALVLLPGCFVDIDFGGTNFRCETTDECPGDQMCIDGACSDPDGAGDGGADDGDGGSSDAGPPPATGADILFYSFDDYQPAGVIQDRSGNRLDSSPRGSTAAAGIYGGGVELGGDGDYVRIPDNPKLFSAGAITIEAWVRPDVTGLPQAIYSDFDATETPQTEFSFEIGADDRLHFFTSDGCDIAVAEVIGNTDTTIIAGSWVHVAVAWDGTDATFYKGGMAVDTQAFAPVPCQGDSHYRVGRRNGDSNPFDGLIDEVKVSSWAKATEDIVASMNHDSTADVGVCGDHLLEQEACDVDTACCNASSCTLVQDGASCGASVCQGGVCQVDGGRVTDGLLALYAFDEGTGTTVGDTSGVGTALDLTIDTEAAVTWGTGTLEATAAVRIFSPAAATKIRDACVASDQVTLEAWVEPASITQGGPARVVTMSADANLRNITLGQVNGGWIGRLRSVLGDTNGQPNVATGSGEVTLALTHLVVTYSAGTRRLYVDGRLRATNEVLGELNNWDATYHFGLANELVDARPWLGTYHLVAVYDRALSDLDVAQNFNAGAD